MYEPREDSFLIKAHIKDYAKGSVLDMGAGSGILAEEASGYCDIVTAADIDGEAINFHKKFNKNKKIKYVLSDLFSNIYIRQKFDLIIFNPPYLPDDPDVKDIALDGGKKGYGVIERFIKNAGNHLKKDGKILMLFSSLTNKPKVDKIIKENGFKFKLLETKKMFFEELYVYLIENGTHQAKK